MFLNSGMFIGSGDTMPFGYLMRLQQQSAIPLLDDTGEAILDDEGNIISSGAYWVDTVGLSSRTLYLRQYIQADGTGKLTNNLLTDTCTMPTSSGTSVSTFAAGEITLTAGTLWSFTVEFDDGVVGQYEFASKTGLTSATAFDVSGNGRHLLLVGFIDYSLACAQSIATGSDWLNQYGFSQRENLISNKPVDNGNFTVSISGKYYKLVKKNTSEGGAVSLLVSTLRANAESTAHSAIITVKKVSGSGTPFSLGWYSGGWSGHAVTIVSGPGAASLVAGVPTVTGVSDSTETVISISKNNFTVGAAFPNLYLYPAGLTSTAEGDGALICDMQICENLTPRSFTQVYNVPYALQPKAANTYNPTNLGLLFCVGDSLTTNYVPYLQAMHPISYIRGSSISGELLNSMFSRLQSSVIDQGADKCIIFGGTNDAYQGVAIATSKSYLQQSIVLLESAGIDIYLSTLTPSATHDGYSGIIQAWIDEWNVWIKTLGLPVADMYEVWRAAGTDGLNPLFDSGDGLHPSSAGSFVEAQAFSSLLGNKTTGDAIGGSLQNPGRARYNLLLNEVDQSELWVNPTVQTTDANNFSTFDVATGTGRIKSSGTYVTLQVSAALTVGGHYRIIYTEISKVAGLLNAELLNNGTSDIAFNAGSKTVDGVAGSAHLTIKRSSGVTDVTFKLSVQRLPTFAFPLCAELHEIDQAGGGDFFFDSADESAPIYRTNAQWRALSFVNKSDDGRVGIGPDTSTRLPRRAYVYAVIQDAINFSRAQRYIGN